MGRNRIEQGAQVAQQEAPTAQEIRSGNTFSCGGCAAVWPLRFKHPREILCLACGRAQVRERKRSQRARAHDADAPSPATPKATQTVVIQDKIVPVDAIDDAVLKEIDRIVREATRKKPNTKPGTGLVRR